MKINGKKHSLIQINIFDDNTILNEDIDLIEQANDYGLFIAFEDKMIDINMPLII